MEAVTLPRRNTPKFNTARFFQYLVLTIVVLVVLVPIVILVFGSLKTRGQMYSLPYTVPIPAHWENYTRILQMPTFWSMLRNSLVVMLVSTAGVLIICSLAAFVFARIQFRGKDLAFNFLTLGLMFPITVAIMPVYLVIRQMHLTNSLTAVILIQTAFALSGNIMILRGFFLSIPVELQDAASIDGCSAFDFFWRILMPLARPALSAVGALTMITSWNDLLTPLVIIDREKLWTLPLGTMQFQGQYGMELNLVAAFVAISAVPAVVFYLFAERQIVAGLTAGALKG
jgi:raffinose/stachyose/melibiose transport system permease protein